MSSSSSTTEISSSTTLPTTTTFLPILDDLLSPDFRPVTLPVATPLQTPTTATTTANNPIVPVNIIKQQASSASLTSSSSGGTGGGGNVADKSSSSVDSVVGRGEVVISNEDAAVKIQKWWKKQAKENENGQVNGHQGGDENEDEEERTVVENVKHSIRHRRAEEHIRFLESEVSRLKSSLSAERKLRSLQYEAIRSLWTQVQKLSVNNNPTSEGVMTQSCPNGLPTILEQQQQAMMPQPAVSRCSCATEIKELKSKLESELGELRELIIACGAVPSSKREQLQDKPGDNGNGNNKSNSSSATTKRPDTLDLNNGSGVTSSETTRKAATGEELKCYADNMAKFVVERGISDNNNQEGGERGHGDDGSVIQETSGETARGSSTGEAK